MGLILQDSGVPGPRGFSNLKIANGGSMLWSEIY